MKNLREIIKEVIDDLEPLEKNESGKRKLLDPSGNEYLFNASWKEERLQKILDKINTLLITYLHENEQKIVMDILSEYIRRK